MHKDGKDKDEKDSDLNGQNRQMGTVKHAQSNASKNREQASWWSVNLEAISCKPVA